MADGVRVGEAAVQQLRRALGGGGERGDNNLQQRRASQRRGALRDLPRTSYWRVASELS